MRKIPSAKTLNGCMQAGYAVSSAQTLGTYHAVAMKVYKFIADPTHNEGYEMIEYGSFVDVYEGLEIFSKDPASADSIALGIVTTGWAAPIGDDGDLDTPPSERPDRKRVIVYTVRTLEHDCWGAIDIDGNDELIEGNQSEGPLLDALTMALYVSQIVEV